MSREKIFVNVRRPSRNEAKRLASMAKKTWWLSWTANQILEKGVLVAFDQNRSIVGMVERLDPDTRIRATTKQYEEAIFTEIRRQLKIA